MKTTLTHIESYRTCNPQGIIGGMLQTTFTAWVDSKLLVSEVVKV